VVAVVVVVVVVAVVPVMAVVAVVPVMAVVAVVVVVVLVVVLVVAMVAAAVAMVVVVCLMPAEAKPTSLTQPDRSLFTLAAPSSLPRPLSLIEMPGLGLSQLSPLSSFVFRIEFTPVVPPLVSPVEGAGEGCMLRGDSIVVALG
jgi:hypothetical protein